MINYGLKAVPAQQPTICHMVRRSVCNARVEMCENRTSLLSQSRARLNLSFVAHPILGFLLIFLQDNSAKYDKFFQHSGSLFAETAASKARTECARYVQRLGENKKPNLDLISHYSSLVIVFVWNDELERLECHCS